MKPTEILMHEHMVVLKMLEGAERLAQIIETEQTVDIGKVEMIIDFSRVFTDRCHHGKEENHLFVRLQERGMPKAQGPLAVMLQEHSRGRELIRGIEQALAEYKSGNMQAGQKVAATLRSYIELLRAHITKENTILFPLSNRFLTLDDQKSLERAFTELEEREIGAGEHERYHRLAHEL